MMIKYAASPCEGLTLKEITSTISNLFLACFFALPQRCEISRREKDEMEASGVNVARFITHAKSICTKGAEGAGFGLNMSE